MFSGIVSCVGQIAELQPQGSGLAITIHSSLPIGAAGQAGVGHADRARVGLGDSIAVMGACLTVDRVAPPDRFTVTAGRETLRHTTLGGLGVGSRVHLERALRVGDRLDGHLVSGHIDGVGQVLRCRRAAESIIVWLESPPELCRYIAVKGSIAIDGISLTVNEVAGTSFRVNLVPFTSEHTLLAGYAPGRRVNLEVDQVARYLERLLTARGSTGVDPHPPEQSGLSVERLRALGYGRERTGGS